MRYLKIRQHVQAERPSVRKGTTASLRRIFASSMFGMIYGDSKGKILDANNAFLDMVGYSLDEFKTGKIGWREMTPPEYAARDEEAVLQLRDYGAFKPYEKQFIHKDGRRIDVLLGAMVEGSSLESAVAFVVDITAKKQYERALREGEERFRTMAESSPMMIWQGSPEQQITYVNKTLREYHQATLDALIGDGWRNYIHPDDLPRTLEVMEESHGTRGHYEVELRVQRADGMYRWFLSSGAPMLSPSGEFMGYVGTAIDIHDRKMAEEALAHYAQRLEHSNRELEQFATIASHDLQEPLRKIMLFTDHIQSMAPSLDKETQDDLKRIRSAANRMQRLINDLLDLSRITRRGKHFQKVHLGDVTEEAVTALSHTHKDINRRVTLEGAMTIEADPNQMHQMMIQLLDNALKFHKPGELSHVQVNMEPRGENQCRIRIIDDGIGIKPEHWDKIFETFVRLHGKNYPGTGIGLALVHRIVERHGGSITAHSTPEKGATFTVTLPVSQAL